jgi:hypothetical protein
MEIKVKTAKEWIQFYGANEDMNVIELAEAICKERDEAIAKELLPNHSHIEQKLITLIDEDNNKRAWAHSVTALLRGPKP